MNRRSFFQALTAAPGALATLVLSAGLPGQACSFRRVSSITGDLGELAYATICGDGKRPKIYLDGVEQGRAITADMDEGFVLRYVDTPAGNFAFNPTTGECMRETVYGRVDIRIA